MVILHTNAFNPPHTLLHPTPLGSLHICFPNSFLPSVFSSYSFFLLFITHSVQPVLLIYGFRASAIVAWPSYLRSHHWSKWTFSSLGCPPTANNSLARVGVSWTPGTYARMLVWSCAVLVPAIPTAVSSWVQWPCMSKWHFSYQSLQSMTLQSFQPFFCHVSEP